MVSDEIRARKYVFRELVYQIVSFLICFKVSINLKILQLATIYDQQINFALTKKNLLTKENNKYG